MRIYFNDGKQYVEFVIDPTFYDRYGLEQYAYYQCLGDDDDPHYANIYIPPDLTPAELAGTLAHEVGRMVLDWMQTKIVTMQGEIVTEFMEKHSKTSVI